MTLPALCAQTHAHGCKRDPAASEVPTGHLEAEHFTGYMVTVTKHLGPRNTMGTSVISTQTMTLSQILDLQVQLPIQNGPGYYLFSVSDTGGTGDDVWMVKLGPEHAGVSMPGFPSQPGSAPQLPPATR